MNEPDIKVKQQIVEKIKNSTNILITVSKDPSVDDLSAALGLTALLNKLEKHGTAIFSGNIPPAIEFLDPEKTFENTVDSLRDFIIALDKEKADHLRYKVEGDFVKIFITPYRTTISGDDLEFSQGDFNVELVLALGVESQDHLDQALAAHGRILHDVTVATFSAGDKVSRLGSLDWHDENASSLSEMVTSISEALKGDKPVLDKQIATALLTGIVAATDRFSNSKTSSRIMTMAAQLMAAGADQQLIAAKLQESHAIGVDTATEEAKKDDLATELDVKKEPQAESPQLEPEKLDTVGRLEITHGEDDIAETAPDAAEIAAPVESVNPVESATPVDIIEPQQDAADVAVEIPTILPPAVDPMVVPKSEVVAGPAPNSLIDSSFGKEQNEVFDNDQVLADNQRQQDDQRNDINLAHSYLGSTDPNANVSSIGVPTGEGQANVDIFANDIIPSAVSTVGGEKILQPPSQDNVSADNTLRSQLDVLTPDLPMPPPLPDFSTLPPPPSPPVGDLGAPAPQASSALDISTLPPSNGSDPGQFKIPN